MQTPIFCSFLLFIRKINFAVFFFKSLNTLPNQI